MDSADSLPLLIVITHFVNLFCIIILIRSGLHILADHPMLYWTDDTTRENYWIKFGKKKMPKNKLWTAHDEAEHIGHYALPGGAHKEFGMARNWHFTAAIIWIITGLIYYGYLFSSGQWVRLIPTNWDVFPQAFSDFIHYIQLQPPPVSAFHPYDPLQQLAYATVVFVLPPIMIVTALAMSPAFTGRFPQYLLLFGGKRQAARSIHFLGMLAFSLFILIHVTLVSLVYFYRNVKLITLGSTHVPFGTALTVFVAALLFLLVFNVWITFFTLNHRVVTRKILVRFITPFIHTIFGSLSSRQHYTKNDISPFFRINGYPPNTEEFEQLEKEGYKNWKLKLTGLIENPAELSLEDIMRMPKKEQITKHVCIQGWTAVAQWGGASMRDIIAICQPQKSVKYVVFFAYDIDENHKQFYEALRYTDMLDLQTILAYEMNGKPLTLEHGAPLRLRCEKKLGYKMVKYIKSIEFTDDLKHIGEGRGGYREDNVMFDWEAEI